MDLNFSECEVIHLKIEAFQTDSVEEIKQLVVVQERELFLLLIVNQLDRIPIE